MIDGQDLIRRFTHQTPSEAQSERHDQLRDAARLLASLIVDLTPHSPEQELAVARLEEAIFWANAAIERHE